MLRIKRCDASEIMEIITHPEIVKHLFDDFKGIKENKELTKNAYFYGFYKKEYLIGCAVFLRMTPDLHSVDVAISPPFRGKDAFTCGKLCLSQHFINTKCKKVYSIIKKYNKPSLMYALRVGFRLERTDDNFYYIGVTSHG